MVTLVDDAWSILQAHACTGLGGATAITPFPVAADPLPQPAALPGAPT